MTNKLCTFSMLLSLSAMAVCANALATDTVDVVAKIIQSASDAVSKAAGSVTSKGDEKKDGTTTGTTTQNGTKSNTSNTSTNGTTTGTTTSTPATTTTGSTTPQTASPTTTATQPKTAEPIQNADGTTEFNSPELGIAVNYPSTWTKAKPDANTISFASPDGDAEFNIQVIPTLISGGKFATPTDLVNDLKKQLPQSSQNFKVIGERDCTYAGTPGREFLAEYTMNSILFRQWFSIISRQDGKSFVQFYFFVTAESYNKYFPSVQKFLGSLRLGSSEIGKHLRYQPPQLNSGNAQGASQLKTPDLTNVDVKLIKMQTESLIQSEKGKYTAKALALQGQILKSEGAQYVAMSCPTCGSKDGMVLEKWQWHCPKCSYVAKSVLDSKVSDGKTCRQALDEASAEAQKNIAAAKDSGNKALAEKGFGPLWNISQGEALDK